MVIRDAARSDVAALVALEVQVYDHPWTERILREELRQANRVYLVAERDGRIVGLGGAMVVTEDAHITTLGVAPGYRRRGIGSKLLLELIDRVVDEGAKNLTLEVRESNVDAQALYERFGFDHVGRRHGYYRNEDALVMWALDIVSDGYQRRLENIRRDVGEAA